MNSGAIDVSDPRVPSRPLVSVWMIAYNHERFVEEAIRSSLAQATSFDFEIVIGEDCSTDRTREIVRDYQSQYPDRIRLLLQPVNRGASINASTTFRACRGKYVATLEADDYWTDRDKLQLQVDLMESTPGAFLCGARAEVRQDGVETATTILPEGPPELLASYGAREMFRGLWWFRTCTKLVPRELIWAVPGRFNRDWAWTMWLIAKTKFGPVCFLDRVVGVYREHAGGIWSPLANWKRRARDIDTLHDLIPLFAGADRQYLQEQMTWNVVQLLEDPDADPAILRRSSMLALKRAPASRQAWSHVRAAFLAARRAG